MIKRNTLLTALLVCTTLSLACRNDDDSNVIFPESFQLVWQDQTFNDGDVIGVYFDDDEVFQWDFLGDDFDEGDDCYVNLKVADLVSVEGDVYTIRSLDLLGGEPEEVASRIVLDGDTLRITDLADGFQAKFSRTQLDVSDLVPSCTFKLQPKPSKNNFFIRN